MPARCIAIGMVFVLGLFLFGQVPTANAEGVFIPVPNRVDMVHDAERHILYITAGDRVLRYDLHAQKFISPWVLGGNLMGIDISLDNSMLAVADSSFADGHLWIHLINLRTSSIRRVTFPQSLYEGGTYSVAFGSDGNVLITSQFQGSGWVPLRRYNPVNGSVTTLLSVRQDTMLTSSADGNVIGFAESNEIPGPWGRYRVSDGNIVEHRGTAGIPWFVYEIGVNRNGTQFALPTAKGTWVFNAAFSHIKTIGEYAGPQPIGVVYHPCKDVVFFSWSDSPFVLAFETLRLTQVAQYHLERVFSHPGNYAYVRGRLKISRDGLLMFATVDGGIRYVFLPNSFSCLPPEVPEANTFLLMGSGVGGLVLWLARQWRTRPENINNSN